jgi:molybdopterin synthase sulfur carrier subunit
MKLELLYFAWLRERVGCSQENVTLPDGVATVADLLAWLRGRGPGFEQGFANTRLVRCAVNQDFAEPDTILHDGDEVAFFPPVTGG